MAKGDFFDKATSSLGIINLVNVAGVYGPCDGNEWFDGPPPRKKYKVPLATDKAVFHPFTHTIGRLLFNIHGQKLNNRGLRVWFVAPDDGELESDCADYNRKTMDLVKKQTEILTANPKKPQWPLPTAEALFPNGGRTAITAFDKSTKIADRPTTRQQPAQSAQAPR